MQQLSKFALSLPVKLLQQICKDLDRQTLKNFANFSAMSSKEFQEIASNRLPSPIQQACASLTLYRDVAHGR